MSRPLLTRLLLPALLACTFALPARAEIEVQDLTAPGKPGLWLVESHEIPFVALELRFRGGASLDAPGKRGATNLMTGLLEEGAGDMDSREFARQAEALAASFSYRAGDDTISISARFLSENRDEAIDLLRQSLTDPVFNQKSIDRVKGQVSSIIRSDETDPGALASLAFGEQTFGNHPYATPINGTLDSIAALTRDDLIAAHKAALVQDRLYIAAVGDITADELTALVADLTAELPPVRTSPCRVMRH